MHPVLALTGGIFVESSIGYFAAGAGSVVVGAWTQSSWAQWCLVVWDLSFLTGIKPLSSALQNWILNHWTARKSPVPSTLSRLGIPRAKGWSVAEIALERDHEKPYCVIPIPCPKKLIFAQDGAISSSVNPGSSAGLVCC